jgi:hypothetical protein
MGCAFFFLGRALSEAGFGGAECRLTKCEGFRTHKERDPERYKFEAYQDAWGFLGQSAREDKSVNGNNLIFTTSRGTSEGAGPMQGHGRYLGHLGEGNDSSQYRQSVGSQQASRDYSA